MERRRSHGWFLTLMVMIVTVLFVSPALAQKQEKITLKIVYEQPITDRGHSLFKVWQEKVNAINPQRLNIQYLGAYEVIPTFEQVAALRKGSVDMVVAAPTFYSGLLPDAMAVQCMGAAVPVVETRKRGMVALMDEIHRKKLGVTVLGALWSGDHHVILVKKALPKADLSGLKIRAIPVQQPAVRTMGGTVTVIPPEEAYTALQSGLLDGVASPSALVPDYRYDEIAKFIYYPLIPMSSWVPLLMRADHWDGLPPDVKKLILDNVLEMEPQVDSFFQKMEQGIIDNLVKKGLKKTGAATEAEDKEATKKVVRAQWKAFVEDRADPAFLPRLNAIGKPALGID